MISILICSIYSREHYLERLMNVLNFQATDDVEIICRIDDGKESIGKKRNELLKQSEGDYVCFIDDDDLVPVNYVDEILNAIKSKPDCVVFDAVRYVNGNKDRHVKYGKEFKADSNTTKCYFRIPNHLMVFKKELALKFPFKDVNFGEDADFAKRILPHIKTQVRIDKVLYHYLFTNKNSVSA